MLCVGRGEERSIESWRELRRGEWGRIGFRFFVFGGCLGVAWGEGYGKF